MTRPKYRFAVVMNNKHTIARTNDFWTAVEKIDEYIADDTSTHRTTYEVRDNALNETVYVKTKS